MPKVVVGRNDRCPCGSGKKYKKCCGMQKTVSITAILEKEAFDLQADILRFAYYEYEMELEQAFEKEIPEEMVEDEESLEFFEFVHAVWFTLFVPLNGKTILEAFIEKNSRLIIRPQLREILRSWTNARPIAGRLLENRSDRIMVKDTLTGEVLDIKLLEPIDTEKNAYLFAFVVPFGADLTLFTTTFDLEGSDGREEDFIQDAFASSSYEDPIEFLTELFLDLVYELPSASIGTSPDDYKWRSPKHQEVAVLFEAEMKDSEAPPMMIGTGLILWARYGQLHSQLPKKAETYAAAIHYINMSLSPLIDVTKKEIAELYGLSPSTLGNAVRDMEYDLEDIISEIRELHLVQILEALESEEHGFDGFDDDDDDKNLPF